MDDLMEKLVALCKRRGFLFQSSEIYGGLNGFWDYGPLGVELKRNIKDAWWRDMVTGHDDLQAAEGAPGTHQMVGLDCSIIMNPKVWEASGHVGGFNDPMVDCRKCKARFRADHLDVQWLRNDAKILGIDCVIGTGVDDGPDPGHSSGIGFAISPKIKKLWAKYPDAKFETKSYLLQNILREAQIANADIPCPECRQKESLTEPRQFNLMFKTYVGALEDDSAVAYLRPETAQGIFANFKNVVDTARVKLPFGIAQIGKAFRNEINPRNFTFRSREFEQMEIEFFCRPGEADNWYKFWKKTRFNWYRKLGLKSEKLHMRPHTSDELAHYAAGCADVEYEFPFGVSELEGVANRTDFDLTQHAKFSGKDLSYFDDQTKQRFVPYVIEPSAGADRATLAFLCEAYTEDAIPNEKGVPQPRTVMKFHPRLAPIKAAVLPLVNKDGMPEMAEKIYRELRGHGLAVFFDAKGAIGRRYRRQDEAGTPFCITVDGQTLDDQTVTFRDRDTCKQWRVAMSACSGELRSRLER